MSQINKIAVIGAGNMGSGIAQKLAQEGLNVVLLDISEEFVERGNKVFKGSFSIYMILRIQTVILPSLDKNVDYLPGILQFLVRKGCWRWNFLLFCCVFFLH